MGSKFCSFLCNLNESNMLIKMKIDARNLKWLIRQKEGSISTMKKIMNWGYYGVNWPYLSPITTELVLNLPALIFLEHPKP